MNDILRTKHVPFGIWGHGDIEQSALTAMYDAMRLPVVHGGALMPDAHYLGAIPNGCVFALRGAVSPYAVGSDIACQVNATIYRVGDDASDEDAVTAYIRRHLPTLADILRTNTAFGRDVLRSPKHEIMDDSRWAELPKGVLNTKLAAQQLGSSGEGNHFVDWGALELIEPVGDAAPGYYIMLLTHSGSRNVGRLLSRHFERIAREKHPRLDARLRDLSWLDLDSEDGQAYMHALGLAGDYADACHEVLHERIRREVNNRIGGLTPVAYIGNRHNFAWQETIDGETVVIHRKGSTPAAEGQIGIIPGSMGDASYIVRGLGNPASYKSASHGAGRLMSRSAAKNTYTRRMLADALEKAGVMLIGGDVDEAPMVYKPIDLVMQNQTDLVEPLGRMTPFIVCMAA